ncbi:MAG: phospho-N-acetylmuramoyl-pentapeptide-transferase [Nitrospirota bacterium]
MIYNLLYPLHTYYSFFNIFRYITFRTIYASIMAFAISVIIGPYIIRALKRCHIRQHIREDGPSSHLSKSGTPTMGGIIILTAIIIPTILWADMKNRYIWVALFAIIGFGSIGFWDDYLKFAKNRSLGLMPRYKLGLQIICAFGISLFLYLSPSYSTIITVPFFKGINPDLGWFYIPFVILVITGASNAVNLTDGLDGLAAGPVTVAALAYTIVTYVTGHVKFAEYLLINYIDGSGELAIYCGAIVGATLGFLWFNTYPASIFMGDVGSIPLGAALGTVAVISKHELLLVLVGGIFVIETISVIFQVVSFKSRGKRMFLMAPIHHHFELKGWEEPKVIVRFWIIAIILALLSLSTLKLR